VTGVCIGAREEFGTVVENVLIVIFDDFYGTRILHNVTCSFELLGLERSAIKIWSAIDFFSQFHHFFG
jgi:hypothetical protein